MESEEESSSGSSSESESSSEDELELEPRYPTEDQLIALGKKIGLKWKPFAKQLKLTRPIREDIEYQYGSKGLPEISLKCMHVWQQRKGKKATLPKLLQALVNIQLKKKTINKIFPDSVLPKPTCQKIQEVKIEADSSSLVTSLPVKPEERCNIDEIIQHIQAVQEQDKDLELPRTSWLTEKILPLEELYVELEMRIKGKFNENPEVDIELHDIFHEVDGNLPKRILIVGNPGYGKSTLIHKIRVDKSRNKDYLNKYSLLFAISLREYEGDFDNFFCDQVLRKELCDSLGDISPETKLKLLKEKQNQILLLLDGYDELNEASKKNLMPLLKMEKYPLMTVIVTSRPGQFQAHSSGNTTSKDVFWHKTIKVKGIPEGKRSEFLQNYFEDDYEAICKKFGRGTFNEVFELFECPLYLLLIAFTLEDEQVESIRSKTDLYKLSINYLVKRNLDRDDIIGKNESVDVFGKDQLDLRYRKVLLDSGKLSLEMLKENRLFIKTEDISKYFDDISGLVRLGFIVKNITIKRFQKTEYYEFVHKTFMEFLAALYMSFLNDSDIKEIIQNLVQTNIRPRNNAMLYSFLTGLCRQNFLTFLFPWSFIFPASVFSVSRLLLDINRDNLASYLRQLGPLIPSFWCIANSPLFSQAFFKSNNHVSLVRLGEVSKAIDLVRWEIDVIFNFPCRIRFPVLVVDIGRTSAERIHRVIQKLELKDGRTIFCDYLICRFFYFDRSIQNELRKVLSFVQPLKIAVIIDRISENFSDLVSFLLSDLLNKLWLNVSIESVGVNEIQLNKSMAFAKLVNFVKTGRISRAFGIRIVSGKSKPNENAISPDKIEELLQYVSSSTLEEFAFITDLKSKISLNAQLLCRNDKKRWKSLFIDSSVGPFEGSFSVEKVEFLQRTTEPESRVQFISSVRNIKKLKCDFQLIKKLLHVSPFWVGYESVTEVQLSLFRYSFTAQDIELLTKFSRLSSLTIDMADVNQLSNSSSFFPEVSKTLTETLLKLKLTTLNINRIDDKTLSIIINLLQVIKEQITPKNLLWLNELKISFAKVIYGIKHEMDECFLLIQHLLVHRLIKTFTLSDLRGISRQEELICKLFDVRKFRLKRKVQPIQTDDIIVYRRDCPSSEIAECVNIELVI